MKRAVLAVVALALPVAAAVAYWAWDETRSRTFRGSPTVEFVAKEPVRKKRPKKVARAEPWPTYGYDVARTHVASDFTLRPPFRKVWVSRPIHLLEFPPVVAEGRVYVAQQQRGRIYALDAETGKDVWKRNYRRCSASSPTVGKDVIYHSWMQGVPCPRYPRDVEGFIVALDADTGTERWRFRAGAIESSPLLVDGLLYFGSWDHRIYALDVRGRRPRLRWSYEADAEVNSSAAYANGTVYIGTDGGSLYAVDARTGRLRWRSHSFSSFGRREYFYATPTVAYGRVYIGNTDGTVYAYGARTGRLLWAQNAGSYVYTAAAVWRKTVYVGSYDGNLYAFDAATGDLRWRHDAPAAIHGAPTVMAGLVYFSTCGRCGSKGSRYAERGPNGTFAVDARTGKLVWRFSDGQYSPIVADGKRVYLTGRTRVYGLVPKTPRRPARARRR